MHPLPSTAAIRRPTPTPESMGFVYVIHKNTSLQVNLLSNDTFHTVLKRISQALKVDEASIKAIINGVLLTEKNFDLAQVRFVSAIQVRVNTEPVSSSNSSSLTNTPEQTHSYGLTTERCEYIGNKLKNSIASGTIPLTSQPHSEDTRETVSLLKTEMSPSIHKNTTALDLLGTNYSVTASRSIPSSQNSEEKKTKTTLIEVGRNCNLQQSLEGLQACKGATLNIWTKYIASSDSTQTTEKKAGELLKFAVQALETGSVHNLSLYGFDLDSEEGMHLLEVLKSNDTLKGELRFDTCRFRELGAINLRAVIENNKTFESLYISPSCDLGELFTIPGTVGTHGVGYYEIAQGLATNSSLQKFHCHMGNKMTIGFSQVFADALEKNTSLIDVSLQANQLEDEYVEAHWENIKTYLERNLTLARKNLQSKQTGND